MTNTPETDPMGRTIAVVGDSMVYVSDEVAIPATTNYAAEDVLSDSESAGTYGSFSNVVASEGGSGLIVGAIMLAQTTNLTHTMTLFLFNAAPTSNLNDNAANASPAWADRAGYIGEINFPAFNDRGGGSKAEVVPGEGRLPKPFKCAGGSRNIYFIAMTENAFTYEIAGHSYIFTLLVKQN